MGGILYVSDGRIQRFRKSRLVTELRHAIFNAIDARGFTLRYLFRNSDQY